MDTYRPNPLHPRPAEAPRAPLWPWVLGAIGLGLVWWFRDLLTLLGAAFGLAWALAPAVDWLAERRVPRVLAIAVVLLGVGVCATILLWIAIPDIVENVTQLASTVPVRVQNDWLPRLTRGLLWLRRRSHLRIPLTADAWVSSLASRASSVAQGSLSVVTSAAGVSLSIVEFAVEVLIVLALSFYALTGWRPIVDGLKGLVPTRSRDDVLRVAASVDRVLGRFVRGQFLVMLILGTLFAAGLGALKVPAGVGLGIFAGLIAFVPYLGFFIALCLATTLAALDTSGQCSVAAVVVYMLVIHLLDILVITPRVLGGSIGLSPIVVIVALLAGAKVFGFLGLLVAVPAAAVLKVLLDELVDWYKSTHFYSAPPLHTIDTEDTLGSTAAPAPRLTQPPTELP
ncbi:MAG: AI-2E family transporter [Polyangiales bacterium]